jgi:flagellar motor switch protein FliM
LLDLRGALNIALPAVVANALLRKLATPGSLGERIPSRNTRRRIRESLLDGTFLVDLSLPPTSLSVRELLNIEPQYVLVLPNRADKLAHLNIAGKPMFEAHPVRSGPLKGARIERRTSLQQTTAKE